VLAQGDALETVSFERPEDTPAWVARLVTQYG